MRDLALVAAIIGGLGLTLRWPFVGVILWTWFSIQAPHEETYSFAHDLSLNLVIAIAAIGSWLVSKEPKSPQPQALIWMILLFLAWTTLNSFFAYLPDWSWPIWNRTWKIFALGLLVATLATNRVRIHALIWTIVISLFYYGVKGGVFTLLTGGNYRVFGPQHTIIGDNNQLAVALLMALPLANYLRLQSVNKYISWGLLTGSALTLIAIIGSYSRGAFVALVALLGAAWIRSPKKILYLFWAVGASLAVFQFMPQTFWDRIATIQTANQDTSFEGRVVAWQVAYRYANDHFPWGAGFYGPQLPSLFHFYFPNQEPHAAHSIYFQVLGENGYIGLLIYLAILAIAIMKTRQVMRVAREHPELKWVDDLGRMLQLTLLAFSVGGAALSMAYYDVFVLCVALLVPLSRITAVHERSGTQDTPLLVARSKS